jgi:hypothetical protein
MTYHELDVACGEPHAGTTRTGRECDTPGRRRGAAAVLSALAVGALSLLAACSTSPSSTTPPAATPPAATPTQDATQTSSPTASSSAAGSSGSVTAGPASGSQLAAFTAAAQGQCGFTSSADTLTNAKVTSNGWGSATITAMNPQAQGNASMVFRLGTSWTYNTCGSSFDNGSIPQDVLTALGL